MMNANNVFKGWIIVLLSLVGGLLNAQIVIGDTNLSVPLDPSECTSIFTGTSLRFVRAASCDPNILITRDGVDVVNSSDTNVSYTFEDEGEYVVFCGATAPLGGSVATAKVCFTVTDRGIPTMGEWAIICLALTLLILTIVSQKQFLYSFLR